MKLELGLKKEGKMLREIGFRVCGHRICMIKAPNVCGICGRTYNRRGDKIMKIPKNDSSDEESEVVVKFIYSEKATKI